MKILQTTQQDIPEILAEIAGQRSMPGDVRPIVEGIIQQVKTGRDALLYALAKRFDGVKLTTLTVTKEEIKAAYKQVSPAVVASLKQAIKNIRKFHTAALTKKGKVVETMPGVQVWTEFRPIEKVGLYVPGGKAAYPSTVLMLAVPAKVAGCREIVICTPPSKDGTCNPGVLVAADLCGVSKIFKVGGAQAIAAMSYGTETIPKVYKIVGPGNQYVATAKMCLYGEIDIDMPAGPSEVQVIADKNANPEWVAADLLSQLEHGEDSQALLVTFSAEYAQIVIAAMERQMKTLPRKAIIQESFARSFAVVVRSTKEAIAVTNGYAPEHFEIVVKKGEKKILAGVNNAGSIFLGPYTSEPLGDYATGANHTLPTSGYAKMFPPLSTEAFGKQVQVQRVDKKGITALKEIVETLADCEGLQAHGRAITIRFL